MKIDEFLAILVGTGIVFILTTLIISVNIGFVYCIFLCLTVGNPLEMCLGVFVTIVYVLMVMPVTIKYLWDILPGVFEILTGGY